MLLGCRIIVDKKSVALGVNLVRGLLEAHGTDKNAFIQPVVLNEGRDRRGAGHDNVGTAASLLITLHRNNRQVQRGAHFPGEPAPAFRPDRDRPDLPQREQFVEPE